MFILFISLWGSFAPTRDLFFAPGNNLWLLIAIIAGIILITLLIGLLLGHGHKEQRTFGILASYKNTSIPTILALTLFSPVVALPSLILTLVNNLFEIPALLWLERSHRQQDTKISTNH